MKWRQTLKQSLKEELLKILTINRSADSFVNARSPYQLTRKAKINWTDIVIHVVLYTWNYGRKQVENIVFVWLITAPRSCLC